MTAQPDHGLSVEDYLFAEREGPGKHEYYAGRVYAMSGASARHNRIAGSTYAALYAQLRKRDCNIYLSDMRVKVVQTGLYTYPDITIVCGHERFEDVKDDTLLNPTIIIEVLSPSTENMAVGESFTTIVRYYLSENIFLSHRTAIISSDICANPIIYGCFPRQVVTWCPE